MTTAPTTQPATPDLTVTPLAGPPPKAGREVVIRGRHIPVVLPKRDDPRLKLSATIFVLTVFGQTILNFQISIPQIAVCVLLCALVEMVITFRRAQILVWPASAIQTGISVAFIFRVAGARHGDLWTFQGMPYFVLVIILSLVPKYVLRLNGRHIFNPSNIGIAWGLLLLGPSHVFSEHLWWKPLGAPVLISMAVIVGGAWWVLRQVRMIPMVTAFMATFCALIGLSALLGRSYFASWHNGPVGGSFYWVTVALSPEVLIFAFFMISDPQTAPKSQLGRIIYAVATATVAAGLIALQTTEFGIKVAILSSLLVTCALVPLIEAWSRRLDGRRTGIAAEAAVPAPLGRRVRTAVRNPVVVAIVIIALAAPINTALLARDKNTVLIERGLTTHHIQ